MFSPPRTPQKQRGISLVELMIAMVLGLIISGAALQMVVDTRQTFNVVNTQTQMMDSARFASEFVGRYLRMAGYRPLMKERFALLPMPAETGSFSADQALWGAENSTGSPSDQLYIRVGEGGGADCNGQPITGVITIHLKVDNNVLTCSVDGGTTVIPLVDNIQNMQLQYGVDTDGSPDRQPNRYRKASDMANADWAKVTSVRVAFLTTAPAATAPGLNKTYNVLDQTVTGNDGHLRQVHEATFSLRNLMRVL